MGRMPTATNLRHSQRNKSSDLTEHLRNRRKNNHTAVVFPSVTICNYSVGLRFHCADRKKVYHGQGKIPSPKAILHGFLPVAVRALNSYHNIIL